MRRLRFLLFPTIHSSLSAWLEPFPAPQEPNPNSRRLHLRLFTFSPYETVPASGLPIAPYAYDCVVPRSRRSRRTVCLMGGMKLFGFTTRLGSG